MVFFLTVGARAEDLRVEKLADGVYAAIATPEGKAVSNSGFIVNDSEVVVVDSHASPEIGRSLLAEIRKVTDKPIRFLVLTHKHRDHVGGASAFGAGVEIVSQENSRTAMLADSAARIPTITFDHRLTIYRSNRTIELLHFGRGHTDGDAVVWLPEEKILFAGDLYFNGSAGFMGDGYLRDWMTALDELRSLPAQKVVPGHGPVSGPEGILRFENYLADFIRAVRVQVDSGKTLEQTLKDFSLPQYKNLARWQDFTPRNITRCYNELKGEKK